MHLKEKFIEFINNSPVSSFAINSAKKILEDNGYINIDKINIELGKKYYYIRNDSSIIAFDVPKQLGDKINMVSSHSDSPYFKIKANPNIHKNNYTMLNTSVYGGMIMSSFVDIPLNIAGRVNYIENGCVMSKLVNFDAPVAIIPNLAIHLNREVNQGYKYQLGKELFPIYSQGKRDLLRDIKERFNIPTDIVSHDLYLTSFIKPYLWGIDQEFISSPRIDNLQCAFTSLISFVETVHKNLSICCIFDNEEVGSLSYMGASSDMLNYIFDKICDDLSIKKTQLYSMIENSFVISADNAHALHPNFSEKYDNYHECSINHGPVIKYSANQSYTTDSYTAAEFINLCNNVSVPYQVFENHSAIRGGSTLGNLLNYHTSLKSIDIGLPQLAMHSALETAGTKDIEYMVEVLKAYYVR